jgi:acetate kinase
MAKVPVINCGSSSIKYEVFELPDLTLYVSGLIERIGGTEGRLSQKRYNPDGSIVEHHREHFLADHHEAFDLMAEVNRDEPIIKDESELFGIGHRVVHGGEVFHEPTIIHDRTVEEVRRLVSLAPLHNPSNILGIEAALRRFPHIPQVAVFDTAFHHTLFPHAFRYAVPDAWYTDYHVRRYGFHGTSHFYVSREAARYLGRKPEELNLITLHLGNGASATAIRAGLSVDTSMGLTPLEGLIMGTRSGDIDPALHFYLMREAGLSADELERSLNARSGLAGICGLSDMRDILDEANKGNDRAILAVQMFSYRIKKYIGAYLAVLGRVDGIVFTGGIGENSPPVRLAICDGLEHMGIAIDESRNASAAGKIAEIQKDSSPVRILVIKTDEEKEICRKTIHAINNSASKTNHPR